jgi:RNA polymerase sigma-70 factor (ECF subfamily)
MSEASTTADEGRTLAALFEEHAPYVWRVLRRLGVAEADVEDLCQEVFLVIHRKLGEFEGRSSLTTWIYGICVRTASDYRRRAHRRREVVTGRFPEGAVSATQPDDVQRRQALALLDEALEALDEPKRAVFVLYEIEELSMPAVAEALECPVQTAYSRLHAARRRVREHMDQGLQRGTS